MDTTPPGHATMSHTHYHYFITPKHSYTTTTTLHGIKTPGGTAFVQDDKGDWTHPERKAGRKREGNTFEFDFDEDVTTGKPKLTDGSGKRVPLTVTYKHTIGPYIPPAQPVPKHARTIKTPSGTSFVKDAKGEWTHEEIKTGGKRDFHKFAVDPQTGAPSLQDDKGIEVPLTVEYEEDFGMMDSLKKCFHDYIGKDATWKSRAVIGRVVVGITVAAYKHSERFRDAVENAPRTMNQFGTDFLEGNGNTRRNAFIGAVIGGSAGVCIQGLDRKMDWPSLSEYLNKSSS